MPRHRTDFFDRLSENTLIAYRRLNQLWDATSKLPIWTSWKQGKSFYINWFANALIYFFWAFMLFQILFMVGSMGLWPGLGDWIAKIMPAHFLKSVELWIFHGLK